MDERRDLVDRTELRRRLVQEREANVEGSQWDYGWRACLAHVVAILNSLDAVECPRGWTRDEVLAELDKHPDAVCEYRTRQEPPRPVKGGAARHAPGDAI